MLQGGIRFQVGDGKTIRIWDSPWLSTTTNFRPTTRRPTACQLAWVSELLCSGGRRWNAGLINKVFLPVDATAILQIPLSYLGRRDTLVWHHTHRGNYIVDSAYKWLITQRSSENLSPETSTRGEQERVMWRRLWGLKIKGKVKHFLWRAYHKILPTCDKLRQKGIMVD